jgi:site-specific DNA-methyltransferase (adenine-specific)
MASKEGDLIFDPFGGAGTSYAVAEMKNRRWIGSELGPCDVIIDRFSNIKDEEEYLEYLRNGINTLFPEKIKKEREKRNLWTYESEQKRQQEKSKRTLDEQK